MPMDPNQQKQQYSIAYLRAITATAGLNLYTPEVDDDSIDWGIKGYKLNGMTLKPQLELQLKCTGNDNYQGDISFPFRLDQKNYNDLCDTSRTVPAILVVVVVPETTDLWLSHSEEKLTLKYCGYWHSLQGETPTPQTTKSIRIDRANLFDVNTLKRLMHVIGTGGEIRNGI